MLRTFQRHKRRPLIGLLIAVGLTLGQAIPAQALNFGFEIFNVNGNVNGSVTGRILGLNDNMVNQAASSVIIDTLPEVFSPVGSIPNPGGFGSNVLPWTEFTANNFSVANGDITSYDVRRSTGVGGQLFFLSDTQFGGEAFLGEDVNGDGFSNDLLTGSLDLGSPQNVVFTPLSQPNKIFLVKMHLSQRNVGTVDTMFKAPELFFDIILAPPHPVPEPSTMILLVSGLAGIVGWRAKKRS